MSSPAGSPLRQPKTTQHPHPVPQSHLYAQSLYADSTTFFSTDFGNPPAQQLEWHEEEVDDGLDLFVENQILPPGTPNCKKETSSQGVTVDGVKEAEDGKLWISCLMPHCES